MESRRRETADLAGFGALPQPREIELRTWKRICKGALIGIAGITLPIGRALLDIDDLPVLMTEGVAWASWPAKPIVTAEGRVVRIAGTSKPRFVNILNWQDRRVAIRFSQKVVELVKAIDPEAFRESER